MAGTLPGPRFHSLWCLMASPFLRARLALPLNKCPPCDITEVSLFPAPRTAGLEHRGFKCEWGLFWETTRRRVQCMQMTCIYHKRPCAQVICAPSCPLRQGAAHLLCPHNQHCIGHTVGGHLVSKPWFFYIVVSWKGGKGGLNPAVGLGESKPNAANVFGLSGEKTLRGVPQVAAEAWLLGDLGPFDLKVFICFCVSPRECRSSWDRRALRGVHFVHPQWSEAPRDFYFAQRSS